MNLKRWEAQALIVDRLRDVLGDRATVYAGQATSEAEAPQGDSIVRVLIGEAGIARQTNKLKHVTESYVVAVSARNFYLPDRSIPVEQDAIELLRDIDEALEGWCPLPAGFQTYEQPRNLYEITAPNPVYDATDAEGDLITPTFFLKYQLATR